MYSRSRDTAATWSTPVRVNAGATVGRANVFPWVDADASGHVVVAWFGANRAGNSNDTTIHEPCAPGSTTCMTNWTQWQVYAAETVSGRSSTPAFQQTVASDHVVHRGTISTGGLTGNANRDLGDYFQVGLDPKHRPNLAFSDTSKINPLGPNAGPDNPATRRLVRVNFTRRLAAVGGISTAGSCATEPAPAATTQIAGQGTVSGVGSFALVARAQPRSGAMTYTDRYYGVTVRTSNGIATFSVAQHCAKFAGSVVVNGKDGYRAYVTACDNDAAVTPDTFSLSIYGPNNFIYRQKGTLTAGDLRLRP